MYFGELAILVHFSEAYFEIRSGYLLGHPRMSKDAFQCDSFLCRG